MRPVIHKNSDIVELESWTNSNSPGDEVAVWK